MPGDILAEPAVNAARRCDGCGWSAGAAQRLERMRDAAETLLVAEMQTRERADHGPILTLALPACPECDHAKTITLALWWTAHGQCYYARRRRDWEYDEIPWTR